MTTARKAPQDRKAKMEDFEYTLEDGRVLTLPPFNSVKPGVIRKIRKLGEVDQFFTVVEELVDVETLAIIDDLEADEFNDFQTAWYKHAGVNVGES